MIWVRLQYESLAWLDLKILDSLLNLCFILLQSRLQACVSSREATIIFEPTHRGVTSFDCHTLVVTGTENLAYGPDYWTSDWEEDQRKKNQGPQR